MAQQSPASKDIARLDAFVGVWDTEGVIRADPPGRPAKFKAADTYEWLPGGYFLLHRFDANMPDGNVQGIEIIGYSHATELYPMHSFDSLGNHSVMQARVENETWTFVGESIRFTGRFREEGKLFSGLWELRSGDGSWRPWMDVRLKRVS